MASLSPLENGGPFGVEKLEWLPLVPGLQHVIFKKLWASVFGRLHLKAKAGFFTVGLPRALKMLISLGLFQRGKVFIELFVETLKKP